MSEYSRDRQLDLLRGIAVMGMFLFSFLYTLSDRLPVVLEHNLPGRLLPGDFVLSLFLFSSGMSISSLRARYSTLWSSALWRKIARRLSLMVAASLFITPFSSGVLGGMDEVMLNAVLTIPTLIIAGMGFGSHVIALAVIALLYYTLPRFGLTPQYSEVYLGGYSCAVFFLPILLGGSLLSMSWRARAVKHASIWAMIAGILWLMGDIPEKMHLTPSFMALSCCASALLLWVIGSLQVTNPWLEYCGQRSLRMWCLMFAFLGPLRLYVGTSMRVSRLSFAPWQGLCVTFGCMAVSYALSKGWDSLGVLESRARENRKK